MGIAVLDYLKGQDGVPVMEKRSNIRNWCNIEGSCI